MKAVTVSKYGDATQVMEITDVEKPTPAAGQVLVKNMAIATNPIDYKAAAGVLAPGAEAPDKRLIVGWDCAGVVEKAGEGVTDFQAGDNVWFAGDITKDGCFAEYTAIDARLISKKPESMSFEDAAALPLTFQTAWEGLVEQMNVQKGKTIFVLNGAGGLGSIVIQLAKHLGLTVIASASREETVSWCKKMGADHIINHRNELRSQLAEVGYPTVDYLFNAHENDRLGELIQLLSVNGKIAITFNASREHLETVDFQTMWMKRQSLVHTFMFGRAMFDANPEMVGGVMASCAKLVDSGIIKSTATTKFKSLTEIKEAIKVQMSGKAMGKIVLTV